MRLRFVKRTPRQANGHGTLQAQEGRTHGGQKDFGVVVQQPLFSHLNSLQINGCGIARLQAHQLQVRRARQPRQRIRDRQHKRRTALLPINRCRHHKPAFAQVGHPVQTPVEAPAIGLGPRLDLQRLDPRQKLHGIGQARRARQLTAQQIGQQALSQGLVRALQDIFDKRALAPKHKRRGQRMTGDTGHAFYRIDDGAAAAAQRRGNPDPQHIGGRQL